MNIPFATLMVIVTAKVALVSSMEYPKDYCYPPIRLQYGGYIPEKIEYLVGHKIEYYCDEGYELQGVVTDECKYDSMEGKAKFTSLPPICKREYFNNYMYRYIIITVCVVHGHYENIADAGEITRCPDLYHPTYGSVSVGGYTLDSTAFYECQDSYKLEGGEYRTCQYDGTWSGSVPTCIREFRILKMEGKHWDFSHNITNYYVLCSI